jgi:TM2 domain-containing membrane protein YozV
MRGQVLGVDHRTGEGIVAGEDGRRYRFAPEDWADRGEPAIGMQVDFETEHQRALALFPVPGSTPARVHAPMSAAPRTDRNKFVAATLAFFLGTLGIHRFYTGKTGTGILMLLLTCTVVGLILTIPWAFIDMIRYLMMSHGEFEDSFART